MIKVLVKENSIVLMGHAKFNEYGKDIVCASASSIVITSINACLKLNKDSIKYEYDNDKLTIDINSKDKNTLLLIDNMMSMLEELAGEYRKNIKIIKEEK